jgi:hypothetical protein
MDLHEATLGGHGALPSSNVLPLTSSFLLLGCADGSFKCYDWRRKSVVKSIKGLGKGDWIVACHAANPYSTTVASHHTPADPAAPRRRRILTLTQKGMAYLIEIEIDPAKRHLEIKPPLARFVGGLAELGTLPPMEHTLLSYDPHRDWVTWMQPATKKEPCSVCVWNLSSLRDDFVGKDPPTLAKPEPNLTIQFPSTDHALTLTSAVTHTAFGADVLVCAVVTAHGDVHVMGALLREAVAAPLRTLATPLVAFRLPELLQYDAGWDTRPVLRVHAIQTRNLYATEWIVATNLGLIVLDLPVGVRHGAPHFHFGAGLGSLGKSVLSIQQSNVVYGSLDVLKANPVGPMPFRNPTVLYESPVASHMPPAYTKRLFRTAPVFLSSPSGTYLSLFWPWEFRYEILHVPTLLQKVGQRGHHGGGPGNTPSPVVAKGQVVADFAWVGDDDVYAVLHAPELFARTVPLWVPPMEEGHAGDGTLNQLQQVANLSNLKDLRSYSKSVAKLGAGISKGARTATKTVTTTATGAFSQSAKAGLSATTATSKTLTGSAKKINKGLKKATFGLFKGKKKKSEEESLGFTADDDEEDEIESQGVASMTLEMQEQMLSETKGTLKAVDEEAMKKNYVELHQLIAVDSPASELSASVAAATSSNLGELYLRGGNRIPTVLFGGPVLCVGSKTDGESEGQAYFYTRKASESDEHAEVYTTSGPALPCPDLCVWDDDGRLCALVVHNRVTIYSSTAPFFSLLGTVQIGGNSTTDVGVQSAKFIHGVLYCCTWNAVYIVFLGNTEAGVYSVDSFLLASTDVVAWPDQSHGDEDEPLAPCAESLPLVQPVVLGYQSGSLMVSTARGVNAISLSHPLLRIGTLLSAGQIDRAVNWFEAVANSRHEALGKFLERRGLPNLALELPGISLETIVDISMRFGYIDRLEEVVETYGVKGIRAIDLGRGVSTNIFGPLSDSNSLVVCVGAYLLAQGSVELVRRLASECLRSGEDGRKDALVLGALLLSVNEADATRLIHRAVEQPSPDWTMGNFVRDFILTDAMRRS